MLVFPSARGMVICPNWMEGSDRRDKTDIDAKARCFDFAPHLTTTQKGEREELEMVMGCADGKIVVFDPQLFEEEDIKVRFYNM